VDILSTAMKVQFKDGLGTTTISQDLDRQVSGAEIVLWSIELTKDLFGIVQIPLDLYYT